MAAQALPSAPLINQSEAPTRTSAAYGQACTNCAKAKCKCILIISHPGSGSGSGRAARPTCERCARLGRECNPSSGIRKRRAAGSRRSAGASALAGVSNGISAASRAANLEQKLEDLVAILKAQATSTPNHTSPQPDVAEPHQERRNNTGLRVATSSATDRQSNNVNGRTVPGGPAMITPASTTGHATCSTSSSTPSPLTAPANNALVSASQAEETLAFFCQHHLKYFPFIYLPPDLTYVNTYPIPYFVSRFVYRRLIGPLISLGSPCSR